MSEQLTILWQDIVNHPGDAYRAIIPWALLGAVAVVVLHFLFAWISRLRAPADRPAWSLWERLVYLGTLAVADGEFWEALEPVLKDYADDGGAL